VTIFRLMAQTPDVRWRQRFQSFQKAFGQLSAAVQLADQRALTDLEKQGLIQAFEFTHELAWNTLKDFLESRGAVSLYGSKDVTRESFAKGLIANGDEWMAMIQARNRSSHTYNEKTAGEIAAAIRTKFHPEFSTFLAKFSELEALEP
jgi:nucleotidyltransferase substrate binding protein (TIGR01987 family)